MFSPPKLTVLRCKKNDRKQLENELGNHMAKLYEKRFMPPPQIYNTDEENIVCFENRVDCEGRGFSFIHLTKEFFIFSLKYLGELDKIRNIFSFSSVYEF